MNGPLIREAVARSGTPAPSSPAATGPEPGWRAATQRAAAIAAQYADAVDRDARFPTEAIDALIQVYKGFKNDLPVINGEPSWALPMPARYVISQDGVIAYAEVSPDYTRRPDPSELIPTLQRLALPA